MKRLRSIILTAAICLALGAVVSYGVAWGISWRASFGPVFVPPFTSSESVARTSLAVEPTDWFGEPCFPRSVERLDVSISEIEWGRSVRMYYDPLDPVVSELTFVGDRIPVFVYEDRFGLPLPSASKWSSSGSSSCHDSMPKILDGGWWAYSRSYGTQEVRFPLRPIWPGLIINGMVYGLAAWALWRGVVAMRARWRRKLGDVCLNCRYPRGTSPVCTECGEAFGIGMASNAKTGG